MRRKRGRPAFKPTVTQRRKVEELRACGMTVEDLARVIGCDFKTLQKHFPDELAIGAAKRRAEVVSLLFRTARKGNVSAQKKLEEMSRAAIAAEHATGEDQPQAEPAPSKLGKKETAQLAAQTAGKGSEWGDDLEYDGDKVVPIRGS